LDRNLSTFSLTVSLWDRRWGSHLFQIRCLWLWNHPHRWNSAIKRRKN